MSNFIITKEFSDLFPKAEIAIILAKNLDNSEDAVSPIRGQINEELKAANTKAKDYLTADVFSENKVISVWRQAFQKFKTKKGARCSIEAMLKRIDKGNEIGPINPLVDIYNTVSLNYGIPCGGEDIDSLKGDMLLTVAKGGESFLPLGADSHDDALAGEVIYRDDEGAVCRCWNWREGERTMLTEGTKNAFLIIESVDPQRHEEFVEAAKELESKVKKYFECETQLHLMNVDNSEIGIK